MSRDMVAWWLRLTGANISKYKQPVLFGKELFMKKKVLGIFILAVMLAGNAFAEIPERIANQKSRINAGIASGKLTRAEAEMLQDNLHWIRAEFGRMKADGRLTPHEIKRLDEMLDRNSDMIRKSKNNPIARVYKAEIPQRIENQQFRIKEGITSGELTRHESETLQDNLNWIRAEFRKMKADGRLGPHEIKSLDQMLDQNDVMIHNKKHNPIRRVY
jgi:hypothetical protein